MKKSPTLGGLFLLLAGAVLRLLTVCHARYDFRASAAPASGESTPPTWAVPYSQELVVVDGKLDDSFYREHPPVTAFVVASDPRQVPAATQAWVGWSSQRLVWAFACDDATPASAEATDQEKDVDPQDRVELFLWSGKTDDPYYCIEIAAQGAVHDYEARFYRRFDDSWAPRDLQTRVLPTSTGYVVEASLSKDDLAQLGLVLRPVRLGGPACSARTSTGSGAVRRGSLGSTRRPENPIFTWPERSVAFAWLKSDRAPQMRSKRGRESGSGRDFLLFAPPGRADMIAGSGGLPDGRVFTGLHLSMNRGITHAEFPH